MRTGVAELEGWVTQDSWNPHDSIMSPDAGTTGFGVYLARCQFCFDPAVTRETKNDIYI